MLYISYPGHAPRRTIIPHVCIKQQQQQLKLKRNGQKRRRRRRRRPPTIAFFFSFFSSVSNFLFFKFFFSSSPGHLQILWWYGDVNTTQTYTHNQRTKQRISEQHTPTHTDTTRFTNLMIEKRNTQTKQGSIFVFGHTNEKKKQNVPDECPLFIL